MVTYLLENGSVETTLTRAKEVRPLAEKMITLGKKNTLASRRQALAFITKESVVKKLFDTIAPEYADRNGGYTQIFKIGPRRGDAAEMAIIRLIPASAPAEPEKPTKKAATKRQLPKRLLRNPIRRPQSKRLPLRRLLPKPKRPQQKPQQSKFDKKTAQY